MASRQEALSDPNLERLERSEVWTRPAADFVVDLSGRNLEQHLTIPQPNRWHESFRNRFSDVLVFGHHHFHGILSSDGRIACQEIDDVRRRVDIHIQHHPGRKLSIPQIYRTKNKYRVSLSKMQCDELEGVSYFGTPIEPLNWGMWLLQAIPSAVDFLSDDRADRFLAYVGREWQRELLNALGISNERLVHHDLDRTYHCNDLYLKQFSYVDLVPTPMEKEIFARVAQNVARGRKTNRKHRLFLSRRSVTRESGGTYRALLNEDALVAAFSDRGYSIVEPELLSFEDQIRAFSEAELIVGLGGAAFFNTVFSPPGTRVVSIESSTNFAHDHACLFGALGHHFAFIFGRQDLEDETPVQKRWTIDVDGVIHAIKAYE